MWQTIAKQLSFVFWLKNSKKTASFNWQYNTESFLYCKGEDSIIGIERKYHESKQKRKNK